MLPALLTAYGLPVAAGALGGGLIAARQGKNPLEIATASLVGGGLGALVPAAGGTVTRFAGQALEPFLGSSLSAANAARGLPVIGGLLPKAGSLAQEAALGSRITGAAKVLPGLAGGATMLGASSLIPNVAAGVSGLPGAALKAAPGVAGAAGVPGLGSRRPSGVYDFEGNPLPTGANPTYGYGQVWGNIGEAANPLSMFNAGRLMEEKEFDTQLRNMQLQAAAMAPWIEGAKKADMARALFAMTVKNNQLTQSNALLGGLNAARNMGATAAAQLGSALTNQYQYV